MDKREYLPIEAYEDAFKILEVYSGLVLCSFGMQPVEIRDNIIRNFIARSVVALKAILEIWKIADYADCWILYRCMLDRLFHLNALANDNTFEAFEEWCFKRQYEYMKNIRGDAEFRAKVNPEFFKNMNAHTTRYVNLSKQKIEWNRPDPKKAAKSMGLAFLYRYGYDYASAHVHPMANDGEGDLLRLANIPDPRMNVDNRLVLNNSFLVAVLIVQLGLNKSNFAWRRIVFDFLTDLQAFLKTGSKNYLATFYKIVKLGPNSELCKKTDKQGASNK